jgi:hypothetical protein
MSSRTVVDMTDKFMDHTCISLPEMHLKSLKLLAMSITVRELTKCFNTVLNLVLYVHIWSLLYLVTVFR